WRKAKYREERYAAIELTGDPRYRGFNTFETLEMYEEMVVSGAWWDFVDVIATQRLAKLLRDEPRKMSAILRKWAVGENIWKRRCAILAQLSFKHQTDLKLLTDCIAPSIDEREFFLRKAIGWALRQHARVDAAWVASYVKLHEQRLSGLSKREAL